MPKSLTECQIKAPEKFTPGNGEKIDVAKGDHLKVSPPKRGTLKNLVKTHTSA